MSRNDLELVRVVCRPCGRVIAKVVGGPSGHSAALFSKELQGLVVADEWLEDGAVVVIGDTKVPVSPWGELDRPAADVKIKELSRLEIRCSRCDASRPVSTGLLVSLTLEAQRNGAQKKTLMVPFRPARRR